MLASTEDTHSSDNVRQVEYWFPQLNASPRNPLSWLQRWVCLVKTAEACFTGYCSGGLTAAEWARTALQGGRADRIAVSGPLDPEASPQEASASAAPKTSEEWGAPSGPTCPE